MGGRAPPTSKKLARSGSSQLGPGTREGFRAQGGALGSGEQLRRPGQQVRSLGAPAPSPAAPHCVGLDSPEYFRAPVGLGAGVGTGSRWRARHLQAGTLGPRLYTGKVCLF